MKNQKEYYRIPFELFPAKFYPGLITLGPLLQESSIPQSILAVVPRIVQIGISFCPLLAALVLIVVYLPVVYREGTR